MQFTSWSASKHAKASPATECEACHGNGADYAKLPIIKDPAKAKEAGLVLGFVAVIAGVARGPIPGPCPTLSPWALRPRPLVERG